MYKIYLHKGDLNEATSFYIEIIKKALINKGESVEIIYSLDALDTEDKVITIQAKAFSEVLLKKKNRNIINWYQGIVPEEAMCTFEESYSKYIRYIFWSILEKIALKKAITNIFVSESMLEHYKKKYGYNKDNYFIMPCFNQNLNKDALKKEKYSTPSFVYAGSLSRWQCIDKTLMLFKKIKENIPHATLTLLTKDIEKAKLLCKKYQVDAIVKFVPSFELQNVLNKFKYGFIVRDNIAVNNVATPTKMNSYMASGIIPVYSDVIGDFSKVFKGMNYTVPFLSFDDAIKRIIKIEETDIDCELIKTEYEYIFNTYYSSEKYLEPLGIELTRKI